MVLFEWVSSLYHFITNLSPKCNIANCWRFTGLGMHYLDEHACLWTCAPVLTRQAPSPLLGSVNGSLCMSPDARLSYEYAAHSASLDCYVFSPSLKWAQLWLPIPVYPRKGSLDLSGYFFLPYWWDLFLTLHYCFILFRPTGYFNLIKHMSYFCWFQLIHCHQEIN